MEKIKFAVSTDGENYGVAFLSSRDFIRRNFDGFNKFTAEEICRFGNVILKTLADEETEIVDETFAQVLLVGGFNPSYYVLKTFQTVDDEISISSHGFLAESDAERAAEIIDVAINFVKDKKGIDNSDPLDDIVENGEFLPDDWK